MNALRFARQTVDAVSILLVLLVAGCPKADPGDGSDPNDISDGGLTAEQKRRADQIVSVFENDTIEIQYAYIENIDDGRGYTAGRAGFTSATGDMLLVVERYTAAAPGNPLAAYLPRLRQLADDDSAATDGLEGLPQAWEQASADSLFRVVQDEVVDQEYYRPAVVRWRELGLTTPLSLAALYDAIIQHGEGEDPDGLPAMIDRTTQRAAGSPATGVTEETWLSTFLDVRRETLAFASDPETRAGWAESVDRVEPFRALLDAGNFDMNGPIIVDTEDHQATIP